MTRNLFFTFAGVCLSTHAIRSAYEILKHRKLLNPGKVSFVIILINMLLLWVSWFMLCSFDIYKIELPWLIKYSGILLVVIGVILFLTALITIRTLETYEGDLITTGVYSKIRHPMYLGFILWLLGFPIFFGAMFSFVLSLLFIANVLFWRYLEEDELIKRFPPYADYKKKTAF
jgi:protein-S-isoprenylcysteine O-methyltransferase Ste14